MTHFESIPYGWAKDTIRYLVALMLKAGSIQLRVSGKDITVFGESAVAAMGNNNAFGKISISLNTDGTLTVPELLNAAKILMGVLGAATHSSCQGSDCAGCQQAYQVSDD